MRESQSSLSVGLFISGNFSGVLKFSTKSMKMMGKGMFIYVFCALGFLFSTIIVGKWRKEW